MINKMRFECHYCLATFPNFVGLQKHFEAVHRDRDEYVEFPVTEDMIKSLEEKELFRKAKIRVEVRADV